MRLIDADEYSKELSAGMMFYMGEDEGKAGCYEQALDDLAHMPMIDAEPVVHAHWTYNGVDGTRGFRCSNCHHGVISRLDYYSSRKRNYCYSCGAKMDEEVPE